MQVTEIVVSAGRVVSHPLESYANLRPSVTLKATLSQGEDYFSAVRALQASAEMLVEEHKDNLVRNLIERDRLEQQERKITSLEKGIKRDQRRLEELRNGQEPAAALESYDPL